MAVVHAIAAEICRPEAESGSFLGSRASRSTRQGVHRTVRSGCRAQESTTATNTVKSGTARRKACDGSFASGVSYHRGRRLIGFTPAQPESSAPFAELNRAYTPRIGVGSQIGHAAVRGPRHKTEHPINGLTHDTRALPR